MGEDPHTPQAGKKAGEAAGEGLVQERKLSRTPGRSKWQPGPADAGPGTKLGRTPKEGDR